MFGKIIFLLLMLVTVSLPVMSKLNIFNIGAFSNSDISGWDQKSFNGETLYEIENQEGLRFLRAISDMSASAFYKKVKVDLNNVPYLNWSWKVDKPLKRLNEQTKAGDDYAARVYVIARQGLAPWRTKALNYVWSSNAVVGEAWPNAFTDKAIMIPLRTRSETGEQWRAEKVNVKKDFKKYFGLEIDEVDGIAIMTDTDNSKSSITAAYGDLFFSAN
ncbi:MAG: DUF3047 domain-containing protein [Gammaproteobacteria bacterium]|nr:DUF3047 domain-containing protein [Gammaproteobacteria bacterium]